MDPKDSSVPRKWGIPVNFETGAPITEQQELLLTALDSVLENLRGTMHQADGSIMPGEHQPHQWSTRLMSLAATHLETAELFMKKAVLTL